MLSFLEKEDPGYAAHIQSSIAASRWRNASGRSAEVPDVFDGALEFATEIGIFASLRLCERSLAKSLRREDKLFFFSSYKIVLMKIFILVCCLFTSIVA